MPDKEPVLLTVLIETVARRWYVAGIDLVGQPLPLLVSEPGNLSPYLGLPFDEQVSFLRHRLSGVLQRGCDRLWGRQKKPSQIVFVVDGPFAEAEAELTPRVAEHFVEWMTRPPVVFFIAERGWGQSQAWELSLVAGSLDPSLRTPLEAGLRAIAGDLSRPDAWELSPTKRTS